MESITTVQEMVNVADTQKSENKKDYNLMSHLHSLVERIDNRRREDMLLKKDLQRFMSKTEKQLNKKNKKARKHGGSGRKKTGFSKKDKVPPEFVKLFNMDTDEIERTSISKLLHKYLKENNLKLESDKRVHRVNSAIQEAFLFTDEQVETMNKSTVSKDKDGFNFYNVQNYIKLVYDRMNLNSSSVVQVETSSVDETVRTEPRVQVETVPVVQVEGSRTETETETETTEKKATKSKKAREPKSEKSKK
jgi:hypothetical protein